MMAASNDEFNWESDLVPWARAYTRLYLGCQVDYTPLKAVECAPYHEGLRLASQNRVDDGDRPANLPRSHRPTHLGGTDAGGGRNRLKSESPMVGPAGVPGPYAAVRAWPLVFHELENA
jgi:hypothetical protein